MFQSIFILQIFSNYASFEGLHQKYQAVLNTVSIDGLRYGIRNSLEESGKVTSDLELVRTPP